MRVVAGSVRGHPLKTPPGDVRPTMDRVRGAIFSSLGDSVPGAKVLDLFAGSGALAIEALSRGADSAVLVESNPRCVECIRQNLRTTRLEASVQTMDALRFLDLYGRDGFDIIFADPPYAKLPDDRDFASELAQSPALAASLRPGGIAVIERMAGRPEPVTTLALLRIRTYGKTEVAYYARPE